MSAFMPRAFTSVKSATARPSGIWPNGATVTAGVVWAEVERAAAMASSKRRRRTETTNELGPDMAITEHTSARKAIPTPEAGFRPRSFRSVFTTEKRTMHRNRPGTGFALADRGSAFRHLTSGL